VKFFLGQYLAAVSATIQRQHYTFYLSCVSTLFHHRNTGKVRF